MIGSSPGRTAGRALKLTRIVAVTMEGSAERHTT